MPSSKILRPIVEIVEEAVKSVNEARSAGKTGEMLEARQAPATTPRGGKLLPREQGMYPPNVPQVDLPRQAGVDKARAAGKKPKYTERMQDLLDSPTARKKVDKLIEKGEQLGMREWYGTEPLRQAALDVISPEQYESLMAQLASASQRNPVDQQNLMGSLMYYMQQQGKLDPDSVLLTNKLKRSGFEGPSIELPEGYGSLAQGAIFNRAKQIAAGDIEGALPPERKLGTFYRNLLGNLQPVTVDVNAVRGPVIERGDPRWLVSQLVEKDELGNVLNTYRPREMVQSGELSLKEAKARPGFWEAAPSGSEYAGFEDLWQRAARRADVAPAEAQALGWYGSADVTALKTKPELYVDNLERLLNRTAEVTGKSPLQVLREFLKGEEFLKKADGGAVIMKEGGLPKKYETKQAVKDIVRGGLSNLESLVRGSAAGLIGGPGDINEIIRDVIGYNPFPDLPTLPTSEKILKAIPRISETRPETEGMELAGQFVQAPKQATQAVAKAAKAAAPAVRESMYDMMQSGMESGLIQGPSYVFIGPNAKTWSKRSAKEFEKLEKAGVSNKEAFKKTGTLRSPDGDLRQEASDKPSALRRERVQELDEELAVVRGRSNMEADKLRQAYKDGKLTKEEAHAEWDKIRPALKAEWDALEKQRRAAGRLAMTNVDAPLGKTLYHPEAFKAYPDLRDIMARYAIVPGDFPEGYLKPNAWELFAQGPTTESARSVILHEMQHGIQKLENFGRGSNVSLAVSDMLPSGMYENDYLQQLRGSMSRMESEQEAIRKALGPTSAEDFNIQSPRFPQVAEHLKLTQDIEGTRKAIEDIIEGKNFPAYQRSAGEAEARAVQQRMGYGPERLREIFPLSSYDVPLDQLIVKRDYNDGGAVIMKKGGSLEQEFQMSKGGLLKKMVKAFDLPPASAAQKTQIPGTEPTYRKAKDILNREKPEGRTLDYGSGLGIGSRVLGAESFEPFPREGVTPTFIKPEDIPTEAFDRLVNLNMLNVVPRDVRDAAVENIGRVMRPGGMGLVTTRGKDVMKASGEPGPEANSMITSIGTYQKGFTPEELREYLKYILGRDYEISRLGLGPAGAMIKKKADGGAVIMKTGGKVKPDYKSAMEMMFHAMNNPSLKRA